MSLRVLSPIHKAYRHVCESIEIRCADLGISATEAFLLSYLQSYSPAPVSEFHRALGVPRSTLTSLLDRLETRGWLIRRPSDRDRRVVLVGVTEAGRAVAEKIRERAERLEADIGAAAEAAEFDGFNAVVAAVGGVFQSDTASLQTGGDAASLEKETA
ncbi:MAG: MarR family transcriptional regulator [Candidatus Latescibacterota bacterium]|jgi:DNA-binding MarR family transcriptional regulator